MPQVPSALALSYASRRGESQVRRAEELIEQAQPFDPRHMARASFLDFLSPLGFTTNLLNAGASPKAQVFWVQDSANGCSEH